MVDGGMFTTDEIRRMFELLGLPLSDDEMLDLILMLRADQAIDAAIAYGLVEVVEER